MKNLLYTLLIGLVVISCNKEDMGSGNAPLALSNTEEIAQDRVLSNLDRTLNLILDKATSKKHSNALTSKTAIEGSYVRIAETDDDNNVYEFLFGDDWDGCDVAGVTFTDIYLVLDSNLYTEVRLGSINGTLHSTIERDLTALFELDLFAEGLAFPFSGGYIFGDLNNKVFDFTGTVIQF